MNNVKKSVVLTGVLALVLGFSTVDVMAEQQPLIICVKAGTGMLRIPLSGESCKNQERPLGFNDLPLLVALQNKVLELENRVDALECQSNQGLCKDY